MTKKKKDEFLIFYVNLIVKVDTYKQVDEILQPGFDKNGKIHFVSVPRFEKETVQKKLYYNCKCEKHFIQVLGLAQSYLKSKRLVKMQIEKAFIPKTLFDTILFH